MRCALAAEQLNLLPEVHELMLGVQLAARRTRGLDEARRRVLLQLRHARQEQLYRHGLRRAAARRQRWCACMHMPYAPLVALWLMRRRCCRC